MHIAIDGRVIDDHFPGIGRYVYHLTEALATGHPEHAFTLLTGAFNVDPAQARRLSPSTITPRPNLDLVAVDAAVFGLAAQWRVPAALRRSPATLFHATYWLSAYWPGLPSVLSLYDLIGLRAPGAVPPHRRWLLRLSLRLALRNAREILTLSASARDDLQRHYGIARERITVTPLAADARFHPQSPDVIGALRARYDLPERFVLYVGSNKPHKNLATLLTAWRQVEARRSAGSQRAELVLAGHRDARYGPRPAELSPLVRELGPVPEDDLPALYSAATVFAFPSRHEGFGLPVLEAMACGTPVVAAAASSLPEVVGDAGLLVPPTDASSWADTLDHVLGDPSVANRLAALGRSQATRFSWARTATLTLEAYRRATGARRPF